MVSQSKKRIRRFSFAVKIVILDDELEFSKILDKKIKAYCARKDLLYDCKIFSSSKSLLSEDLSSVQAAFLDIDLPDLNGLEIAAILRQRYPEMVLIFVTSFIEYAPSGYKVNAFRYLLKAKLDEELLLTVIIGLFAKNRFQFKNTTWKDWLRATLFPLTTIFCSVIFFQIYEVESAVGTELLLCEIILLFFDVMAIWILDYMDQQQAALQDNIILKRSIKQEKESMEALVEAYSDQRKKTHDFQNQLAVIYGLAQQESPNGEIIK